ncbi:MAG: hypothetical protein OXD01_10645 [Gammaproteobacteria bacterium]|nr:hypothetical protein [Gammaproteobacteria bacterium]
MAKERILITVKTYPTISRIYTELVCTAGIREDGSWVHIYPVPFRALFDKYVKFQWVEMDLIRRTQDRRHKSHQLKTPDSIILHDKIDTKHNWQERKFYV